MAVQQLTFDQIAREQRERTRHGVHPSYPPVGAKVLIGNPAMAKHRERWQPGVLESWNWFADRWWPMLRSVQNIEMGVGAGRVPLVEIDITWCVLPEGVWPSSAEHGEPPSYPPVGASLLIGWPAVAYHRERWELGKMVGWDWLGDRWFPIVRTERHAQLGIPGVRKPLDGLGEYWAVVSEVA